MATATLSIARRLLVTLLLPLCMIMPAHAEEPASLLIDGLVNQPLHMRVGDLAGLPQTDVRVTFISGHGAEEASYSGVTLWSLIEKAGLSDAFKNRKTRTSHYLVLTARDGYQVILSLAEIDPDLEGKPVIIALTRDGKPIETKDMFRLALPGDKHGARNLYGLIHIELK